MIPAKNLQIAAEIAKSLPVSLDTVPYTPTFDSLYAQFRQRIGRDCTQNECWLSLLGVRKRGLLGARVRKQKTRGEV